MLEQMCAACAEVAIAQIRHCELAARGDVVYCDELKLGRARLTEQAHVWLAAVIEQ